MCIPHGAARTVNTGFIKDKKPKKHIKKPSKEMLEKGDPDFVDERNLLIQAEKKHRFLTNFLKIKRCRHSNQEEVF